jgi:membrane protease YdiL (CAAX protease family)
MSELVGSPTTLFALGGMALVAPWVEEIVFRGYLFGSIQRRSGHIAAIAVSSILFAVVHIPNNGFSLILIHTSIFGLALGLLRWKSGSLGPCVVMHLVGNGILVMMSAISWLLA